MAIELYPYQAECIKELWRYWKLKPRGAPLIVAPTGSGKSLILSSIISQISEKHPKYRFLIATHTKEIVEQNSQALIEIMPNNLIGIYSAGLGLKQISRITFANIQSIYRKAKNLEVDMLIIDECFTGETLISTPSGPKRIDLMRCGDMVYNSNGIGIVQAVSSRQTNKLIKVEFSDGTKFTCTENHPIFTDQGWVKAGALAKGSFAFSEKGLRLLLERNPPAPGHERQSSPRKNLEQDSILLDLLRKEIRESNEQPSISSKNESKVKRDKTSPYQAWRERAITILSSISAPSCSRGGVGVGGFGGNQSGAFEWNISEPLQDRRSEQRKDDRNRDRRRISCRNHKTRTGSKKICASYFPRVVNVSTIKRESATPVFNLHVSGHPSYFANGKLVHNCHLVGSNESSMYQQLITGLQEKNPLLKILGLTATPMRMDQGSLIAEGSTFTDIAYDISIKQLIEEKYLTPLLSLPREAVDLTNVKTSGFDYNQKDLEDAFNRDALIESHCQDIIKAGADRKHWLIFCSGIDHARDVMIQFRALGIDSDYITGEMCAWERDTKLARFRNGEIKALCNVNVLTTGFNFRAVDLVALLRATKSASLYVQIVGRGARTAPGKENCLVLDYGGNIDRHGPVDLVQVKISKDKRATVGIAPHKSCPLCKCVVFIKVLKCPNCGFDFPEPTQALEIAPAHSPIISIPITPEVYPCYNRLFKRHEKMDKPDSFKIEYHCTDGAHSKYLFDFLCFEHPDFAGSMARKKWIARGGQKPPPNTVAEALERVSELPPVTEISAIRKGKYYEILSIKTETPEAAMLRAKAEQAAWEADQLI